MRRLLLIGSACLAIGASAPVPLPVAQPMTAGDRAAGAKAHPQLLAEFGGLYEGPQAAYVTKVGQKIAMQSGLANTQSAFTVSLLNSSVSNAFAIPGGYVYVTRQLLALMNDEAELASVMGHEVGHVAARHAQQRNKAATKGTLGMILGTVLGAVVAGSDGAKLGQQLAGSIAQRYVLKYSRSQEYQADDLGVSYLGKAGYDPMASSTMLASLAAQTSLDAQLQGKGDKSLPEWASTHPDPASRVTRAADRARLTASTGSARNREAFLAAIDGVMYDDDPHQGVIEARTFRHPDLKLAFDAPAGFAMVNSPQAVIVSSSNGQAQFASAAFDGNLGNYVDAVFKNVGGQTVLNYGSVTTRQVNGLKAAYASAGANTQSGPVVVTVYAYEFAPNRAYHIVAITPSGSEGVFNSLFESVRRLSDADAAAIRPKKVTVVTVKSGDTVSSLAARMAYADFKTERFRVLNALSAGAALKTGQKVKIVVPG
ncbi:M48 family metalloprotease [Aquisediminimonas profunda]|uniref:M48 family metalloprotease n=1 Tax=Aquisediminimonas profunda TaxID=1550733 RepID=UPI001C627684